MDNIKKDFVKRRKEAELYLDYLDTLNQELTVNDVFPMLKANYYLILYNIVESTFNSCVKRITQEIDIKNIKYAKLNNKLQETYFKYHAKQIQNKNQENSFKHVSSILQFSATKSKLNYSGIEFDINGNLDIEKMIYIAKKIGFSIESDNRDKAAPKLKDIKNTRNSLAHGNISFMDFGRQKAVSDLKSNNAIFDYLEEIISNVSDFLSNKEYLK